MKSASDGDLFGGGHPNGHHDGSSIQFGCTAQELSELTELDRQVAINRIQERYGSIEQLCKQLHTSPRKGLSGSLSDLQIRTQRFGSNASKSVKMSENLFPMLWNATWDITLGVLIAAIMISFGLSFLQDEPSFQNETKASESKVQYVEYIALLVIVIVMMLAIAFVEWLKQRWIRAAGTEHAQECMVLRGGEVVRVTAEELVVGDVCYVKCGDFVPASGFLIHGNKVKVKERLSSGTVQATVKDVRVDPVLRSGSHVIDGSGKIVITKVGPSEELSRNLLVSFDQNNRKTWTRVKGASQKYSHGQKLSILDEEHFDVQFHQKRKSVLEGKVKKLTIRLCYAGAAGALLVIVILIVRLSVKTFVTEKQISVVEFVQDFMRCLLLASSLLVVIVSMRLPAAVILSFAQTLRRMIPEGNVVHHVGALENLAYTNYIITNKTGALTKNRMSVAQLFSAGRLYKGISEFGLLSADLRSLLSRMISLNTDYSSQVWLPTKEGDATRCLGDERDCALLKFVLDLGQSYTAVRESVIEEQSVVVYPFNAVRKFSSRVIPDNHGGYQLLTKGVSELILNKCDWILGCDGDINPLTRDDVAKVLQNVVQPMESAGLCTICIAFKNYVKEVPKKNEDLLHPEPNWEDEGSIMTNLTCVAIIGIEDELRHEVPATVKKCRRLGIAVRLVTGESCKAAQVTASKCGILDRSDHSVMLEGRSFEAQIRRTPSGPIVPEMFDKIWSEICLIGRSLPENRYSIVQGISEYSKCSIRPVVACIGKDLADIKSLKIADVGISLSSISSEITREASDVVLKDGSLACVVECVLWSRSIQNNLRKLLQFQLTSMAVIFFTVLVGICCIGVSPLEPTHLLWVKIILDLLAPVALSSELPLEELIDCKPYRRTESLFSRSVGKNVIGHPVYQIAVVLILLFAGEYLFDVESEEGLRPQQRPSQHYTVVFNSCIVMTLFHELNSRVLTGQRNFMAGIHHNCVFLGTWIGSFIVQFLFVQFGGTVLSTVALSLEQWGWCLLFGIGVLLWGQLLISLPNCHRHKKLEPHAKDIQEMELNAKPQWEMDYNDLIDDSPLGIMLWRHGLSRLQHQLRVARAFQSILEDATDCQSSQGSLSNRCSLPMLDDDNCGVPKHVQSLLNCAFLPLEQLPQENSNSSHHIPSFKSRSADNMLFEPRAAEHYADSQSKSILPGPLAARHYHAVRLFHR